MSDTNNSQFKQTLLTVLLLLLFLLIGIQTWYMFEMQQQLHDLHIQNTSTQRQAQDTTATEKDMPEKKSIEINNTVATATDQLADEPAEKPANEQLASTQENQQAQAQAEQQAQPQDSNISPDNTPPLINQEPSDTTFGGQAWNPYGEKKRMRREVDRMFERRVDRFTNHPGLRRPGMNKPDHNNRGFQYNFSQNLSTPEIDVRENADNYIVYVNLPGTDKNDISVTLDGQRLSIKGKQDLKKQNRDAMGNVIFQVRQSGKFQRSITLSKPVDQSKMKTHLDNGVLKILIPKVKSGQWR